MKIQYASIQSLLSAAQVEQLTADSQQDGYALTEIPMSCVLDVLGLDIAIAALMQFRDTAFHSVVQAVAIAFVMPNSTKLAVDQKAVSAVNLMTDWLLMQHMRDEIMATARQLSQDALTAAEADHAAGKTDSGRLTAAQALAEALRPDPLKVYQLTRATLLAGTDPSITSDRAQRYDSYCFKQMSRAFDLAAA